MSSAGRLRAILANQVRGLFSNHDDRRIGVAARHRRHDRSIHDAQTLQHHEPAGADKPPRRRIRPSCRFPPDAGSRARWRADRRRALASSRISGPGLISPAMSPASGGVANSLRTAATPRRRSAKSFSVDKQVQGNLRPCRTDRRIAARVVLCFQDEAGSPSPKTRGPAACRIRETTAARPA